jgi:1,2-diacylglycerol 3-beta-galactosyltransferase
MGESSSSSSLSVASNTQKDVAVTASRQDAETDGQSTTTTEQQQQQRPLKILFLSSDTGGGHRASAEALAAQFQRLFPGSTYDLFDVWTDVESSWPYYTIKDTYKSFSATPWKWRALYHVSNNAVYAKLADLHSYYMNEDLITAKMEEYNPDVIGEKMMIDTVLNALLFACRASIFGAGMYEMCLSFSHLAILV